MKEGVIEPSSEQKERIKELLTFNQLPNSSILGARARNLAKMAVEADVNAALLAGPGWFTRAQEMALLARNIEPIYAFSKREVVEEVQEGSGEVRKLSVFHHLGFVRPYKGRFE